MAVASNATGERHDRPDGGVTGLEGMLRALRALRPGEGGLRSCTWACCALVGDVRDRCLGASVPTDAVRPDAEFEQVLARRFAGRYLRVVADAAEGRPVPRVWQLLLDPPPVRPARLALAGVGALLRYDLTIAFVGACTVLGRRPGHHERDAHRRAAALLGTCGRELVRESDDPGELAAAAFLDSPAARDAAWARAEHLWALRGRPAEAEEERETLDREVRADAVRTLSGGR